MSLMLQNFVLFQVGWFSCVIGGASAGYSWIGVVVVALIMAVHLQRANSVRYEMMLILITMLLGTAWDSGLMMAGLYTFSNGVVLSGLVPVWLIAMWGLFATTLNVSMKWMKGRYLLAAVFGAIGGPVAYYAGHKLGAVDFANTTSTLSAVAAGWSVIMPLLMLVAEHFDGYRRVDNTKYEVGTL